MNGNLNQPNVNPAAESFVAIANCNIEAYRQLTQVALDSTERLEKIGISFTRNVVDKSLSAAERAGNSEQSQPAVSVPDIDDFLRAQREIGDTLVNASQQLARTMNDYSNRLKETLQSNRVQLPVTPMAFTPFAFGTDAILNFWNQTYERAGELMRGVTETATQQAQHAQQVGQQVGQQAVDTARQAKSKAEAATR
ncbi:MAG TPA: hypothetical protein VFR86_03540 [Burkholderiaceae bacterium]|nr:hypothetical protein [Burkholderiaceae bacterium]